MGKAGAIIVAHDNVRKRLSTDQFMAAFDRLVPASPADQKVIPGHGPLGDGKDLRAYRDMLKTVSDRVRRMVINGKSRDEVIAARPTSDLDGKWGGGFMKPDQWVGIVYDGMTKPGLLRSV